MSTYWLSNFCSLFSLNINPFQGEDRNERYNALTRLIILITIVYYMFTEDQNVLIAGVISLIISVLIYLFTYNSSVSYKTTNDLSQQNKVRGYDGTTITLPAAPNVSGPLPPINQNAAEELLQSQYRNVMENSTPLGQQLFRDDLINTRAGMALQFVPRDRDDVAAQVYFMKGNMGAPFAETVKHNPPVRKTSDYISSGKEVQTGTVKQFSSMMGRNLAPTHSGAL